jgi:glutathione peroxidase
MIFLLGLFSFFGSNAGNDNPKSIHSLKVKTLEGKEYNLADLKGKKVLIVNTASECGFTPQYKDLQELYMKYKDKNFVVIGFPCNDFGGQEPGSSSEIRQFCSSKFNVTFPMMEKVVIKGENKSEIYTWLTSKDKNGVMDTGVKWNFGKFLINENGELVNYYGSMTNPLSSDITNWIEGKK